MFLIVFPRYFSIKGEWIAKLDAIVSSEKGVALIMRTAVQLSCDGDDESMLLITQYIKGNISFMIKKIYNVPASHFMNTISCMLCYTDPSGGEGRLKGGFS